MPEKDNMTLGWIIPKKVKDDFVKFAESVGSRIQEDCAGALIIWQHLPAELREQAKLAAKGECQLDEDFWKEFSAGLKYAFYGQQKILQKKAKKKK